MTIRYNGMEITFEDNYRPEEIIVDGEAASMKLYADNHDDKNWIASASGNKLCYMTESGKTFIIPQDRFQNTWPDEVRELIQKTGLSMRALADKIGIPYRTIQDWRAGKRKPSNAEKYGFRIKINDLVNEDTIWFIEIGKTNSRRIRVEGAKSIDEAVERLKDSFIVEQPESLQLSEVYEARPKNGTEFTGKYFSIKSKA